MDDMASQLIVIGGGAAGFFAAIVCAEKNPNQRVILLEKTATLLTKVRISGGGRCNVTSACFDPAILVQHYPRGGAALRGPFTRFQPRDTIEWFARHGVSLKTEADSRVFPVTDRSSTIVECLINAAQRANVAIRTSITIDAIERGDRSGFVVRSKSGEPLSADRILLATGSNRHGYQWAAALGHTIEPPVPSLFTFAMDDPRLQGLAGISVQNAQVQIDGTRLQQRGPLLITHWGLSGPAILKLSAWGARVLHDRQYQTEVCLNWLPDCDEDQLRQKLSTIKSEQARQIIAATSPLGLPLRLWQRLIGAAGITAELRWTDFSKRQMTALIEQLLHGVYHMIGKGAFKEEFVTCGGVNLDEVNFKTMESRNCPGLHFAGEILDIDGVTGGFNFQAAWTTGWLAGQAVALC
jgi:predicted Rossmann fold flavoprotein